MGFEDCKFTDGYTKATCFDNVSIAGVTGRVIVLMADVYSRTEITQDTDGVITNIVYNVLTGQSIAGDVGFLFDLPRNNPKPSSPGSKGADGGGLVHTLPIVIPKLTQSIKNAVAALINRNLAVAFVENLDGKAAGNTNPDAAYWELYGSQSMLEASVTDSQRANQDTGAGVMLTLTTPTDATLEATFPLNVNDGVSRATTDAIVLALLVPAV